MDDEFEIKPRGERNTLKYVAVGCLAMVLILAGVVGLGAFFVFQNWRGWASSGVTGFMTEQVLDSRLDEQTKTDLIARVELVGAEFEAERLSFDDIQSIAESFLESPLLPVIAVEGIQQAYIVPADLTDEEKARANRINERLARGIFEKRITGPELNEAIRPLAKDGKSGVRITTNENGTITNFQIDIKPPDQTTPDDLRAFMANAETLLEDKAIPDEPFEVDVIAEFDAAIERAIGRPLVPAAPDTPGPPDVPDTPDAIEPSNAEPGPA